MRHQGINANIMSLGGIAIAIGRRWTPAVVMIENAHKHIEAWQQTHYGASPDPRTRWQLMREASVQEVGPALFISLLINHAFVRVRYLTLAGAKRDGRFSATRLHEDVRPMARRRFR